MCHRTHCSAWIVLMLVAFAGCSSSGESESITTSDTETLADVLQQQSQPGDRSTPAAGAEPVAREAGAVARTSTPADAAAPAGNLSPVRWSGMERYPLRPDGTPDFEKYVLDLYREGVTPENNAAVLWKAMWPESTARDIFYPHIQARFAEKYRPTYQDLGLPGLPPNEEVLQPLRSQRVNQWLGRPGGSRASELIFQARSHPWTSSALPPLAEWVRENEGPLNQIVAATKQSRYCALPFELLNGSDDPLFVITQSLPQQARVAAVALFTRAMWHMGEGRIDDARQDILAMHRLARLIGQQLSLVDQLAAIAIDGMACDATQILVSEGKISALQGREALRNLSALSYFRRMSDSLDTVERAMLLDIVVRLKNGRTTRKAPAREGDYQDQLYHWSRNTNLDQVRAAAQQVGDWDAVLQRCDEYVDQLVATARLPTGAARQQPLAQFEAESRQSHRDALRKLGSFANLSPQERSAMFAATMNGLLSLGISSQEDHSVSFTGSIIGSHPGNVPGIRSTLAVEDRANTSLDMTRLASALAVYRAENGRYPQTLGDLVSGVLAKLPADSYNALPFVYKPDAEGYLLYSMGENGQDDGGSSRSFRNPYGVFEGRSLAGLKGAELGARSAKIPAGADDVAIRLPRPAFDWSDLLSPE